jgi:hypothetical protein
MRSSFCNEKRKNELYRVLFSEKKKLAFPVPKLAFSILRNCSKRLSDFREASGFARLISQEDQKLN